MMLFERKFIFELLPYLRTVIVNEGSYSLDFNEQILNLFLFDKLETSDPLNLDQSNQPMLALRYAHNFSNDKLFNNSCDLYQRLLSFLLESINQQIKTAKYGSITHPSRATVMMIDAKNTLITIVNRLHEQIVDTQNQTTTIALLKFARSLTLESINHFKKVFIFLRESVSQQEKDTLDLRKTVCKLNEIFAHTFSRLPNAQVMRDFFAFLREIFFYTDRMD